MSVRQREADPEYRKFDAAVLDCLGEGDRGGEDRVLDLADGATSMNFSISRHS